MSLYVVLCTKYTNKICLNQMTVLAQMYISLIPLLAATRYSITPQGELHVRDVRDSDKMITFRCKAGSDVTGEVKSSTPAYLQVHGK